MTLKKGDKAIVLNSTPFGDSLLIGEFILFGAEKGYLRVVVGNEFDGSAYAKRFGPYPLASFALYSETLFQQLREMKAQVEEKEAIYNEARCRLREFFNSSK